VKIKFLGTHNAESKNSRLVCFLLDDILAVEAGSLTSELTFTEQSNIRAVLLSHAHYDHIRDTPALAFNNTGNTSNLAPEVFGTSETLQILKSHLIDGIIYPEFAEDYSYLGRPAIKLRPMGLYKSHNVVDGFQVTALPVNHPVNGVGFSIIQGRPEPVLYRDTGPGSPLLEVCLTAGVNR
jgi:Cft2 family RNA processing exonuclease